MVDQLRASMQTVQQAAQGIAGAGTEIAAGNQDLSGRTEQAAGNLQQASSSLAQLTGAVQQTAASAGQASQLAASAAAVAERGGTAVGDVVNTMEQINHSSKRIADIIGTIDGIAFQTNILALNAAVEAARAGEQGRGFAVVASEVRSLAQRSASAAREIKALIASSVANVETGARQVQDAGSTMGEIVASVQRVSDVIAEITAATRRAERGHRPGERHGGQPGPHDAAERRAGGTKRRCRRAPERPGTRTDRHRGAIPDRRLRTLHRRRRLPISNHGIPPHFPSANGERSTMDMITEAAQVARHEANRAIQAAGSRGSGPSQAAHGEYLTFRLGAEEYGIDILRVQEIRSYEQPTRIANAPSFLKGVVNLRGVIVPIVDLRLKLGCDSAEYNHFTVVIVLNVRGRVVGAVVDSVSDVLELAGDAIRPAPQLNANIDAGFITGIGSVAERMLILMDIEALMGSSDMGLMDSLTD